MILCFKTDAPTAELYIYDGDTVVAQRTWEAHRSLARDLLKMCVELVAEVGVQFADLDGIIVFRGPGSFTGLRIGCTVANAIAYSDSLAIVGVSGDTWCSDGRVRLAGGENDTAVLPEYGAPPRITTPKK